MNNKKGKYIKTFEDKLSNKEYLNELSKGDILDKLERSKLQINRLINVLDSLEHLDNQTKKNILLLSEKVTGISDLEMDKELKRQKESGKKFLSDEDIDNIIDKVKREE